MPSNQEDQNSLDLRQHLLILKRRWLVVATVTCCVFGLSILNSLRQKPIYEAEGKLLFNKTDRVSSLTSPVAQIGELSGVTQQSSPLDTEAEIIRSNPIIERTITSLRLLDKQGKPLKIDQFLKQLKIKNVRGTDILQVSYSSNNPKEAADIVNLLMRYYQENNIQINQAQATIAKRFLSQQLPQVEARVVRAEVALRQFKEKNRVVALEAEATKGVERLTLLSDQITQTQANLVDAKTRLQLLQRQLKLNSQHAVDMGNLSQSKGVQQVLAEYQKVQDELAVAQTRYTHEHPVIANLKARAVVLRKLLGTRVSQNLGSSQFVPEPNLQMGELKQSLTAELVESDLERSALTNRLTVLKNAYTAYQKRLNTLPQMQQRQQQLERQLQVARFTYEELLKRFQEVEVVVNQNVGNARVVSAALLPDKDISPRIYLKLTVGGFLGIILGVGAALLLEALDKSLNTVEQAKRLFGYHLLGTIPRWGRKNNGAGGESLAELPVRDNPYSAASSAFEMLQTNLDCTVFNTKNTTLKVISVVSSTPGEGRSFVAANLAVAKAHMGHRVLLVDADMRQPCQQKIWKLPNIIGLSNVLVNQAEFSSSAQEVLVNLNIVTVGTLPPNPSALLDSQNMSLFIKEAASTYDYVIIDTPALNVFPDALMLSKLTDGILLVVRPGVVNLAAANTAKTLLEHSSQRVLGMVINEITFNTGDGHHYIDKYYQQKAIDKEQQFSKINFS
jgi:polysaccharide biosynthesis transport protein